MLMNNGGGLAPNTSAAPTLAELYESSSVVCSALGDSHGAWIDGKYWDEEGLRAKIQLESSPGYVLGKLLRGGFDAIVNPFSRAYNVVSDFFVELKKPTLLGASLSNDLERLNEIWETKRESFSHTNLNEICRAIITRSKHLDSFQFVFEKSDLIGKNKDIQSLLFDAAYSDNAKIFDFLVTQYPSQDFKIKDKWDYSLLSAAIYGGSAEIVEKLLAMDDSLVDMFALKTAYKIHEKHPQLYQNIFLKYMNQNFNFDNTLSSNVALLDEFTKYRHKSHGVSRGGFYQRAGGVQFVLKTPQHNDFSAAVNEMMAGAIYQYFLGERAPEVGLVIDKDSGEILVSSKLLEGFIEINSVKKEIKHSDPAECNLNRDLLDDSVKVEIDGKPIKGYQLMVALVKFLNDRDPNNYNVGLLTSKDAFWAAKVDHGFAFSDWFDEKAISFFVGPVNHLYNNIEGLLSQHLGEKDILCHGYMNLESAIQEIVDTPFEEFQRLINTQVEKIEVALIKLKQVFREKIENGEKLTNQQVKMFEFDLDRKKEEALRQIAHNHKKFQALLSGLKRDKACFENDAETLSEMPIEYDVEPFTPHYQTLQHQNPELFANHPAPKIQADLMARYQEHRDAKKLIP